MAWEDTVDKYANKPLGEIHREMTTAEVEPIVLRWKRALVTSQNVYGFYGCRTSTGEALDGRIETTARIDPDATVTFWPDRLRIGYAVIPKCERNMEILAATGADEGTPWEIETPDLSAELKALQAKLRPAPKVEPKAQAKAKQTIAQAVGAEAVPA
jgi:hypothetical protein